MPNLVRLALCLALVGCGDSIAPKRPSVVYVCFTWGRDASGARILIQRPCTVADTVGLGL